MDKHTKRYFSEQFRHWHEGMNMGEAMDYIQKGADPAYMQDAIQDCFEGPQKDFLQFKLYESIYEKGEK